MNVKRFIARSSREALNQVRMAFGAEAVVLSNRPCEQGVEVLAMAPGAIAQIEKVAEAAPAQEPVATPASAASKRQQPPALTQPGASVEQDVQSLAMSTLSFQDYVRERMLRRRQTETPSPREDAGLRMPSSPAPVRPAQIRVATEPVAPARPQPVAAAAPPVMAGRSIGDELQAMRDLIEERFNTFAWLGQARQHPIQANLMLKLLRAGYSPALARAVLERMPETLGATEAMQWMIEAIQRNLHTDQGRPPLHQEGGIHALVGATGVGKTTTAAKIAGLCAQAHGPGSVGLITLDTQRVGAHAQLREHARGLGLVAHLAHDRAALQDLLGLFAAKKMVLIDTTGLAPRDPRRNDALDVLDLPGVRRLLVLNAGAHGDTMDDMVAAFQSVPAQPTVLTKIDEAVKLAPALDVAIRHQLALRGVTNGQQVPHDWQGADAGELVRESLRASGKSAFDPKAADLGFLFQTPQAQGAAAARSGA